MGLACGTGRLTLALAQSGLSCIGIDESCEMLSLAVQKPKGLNISYLQGDMRHFQLDKKFDLITMGGNSFQALLTEEDQDLMIECVRTQKLRCTF